MNSARNFIVGSLLAFVVLVGLLGWKSQPTGTQPNQPLLVYCAAGLKAPMEAVAHAYEARYGIPIQLQFGGSGALLSNLRVARQGDLFLAADESFLELARAHRLIAETLPLAHLTPVVAVRKDSPHKPQSLAGLEQKGLRLALANPEAAAIG